MKTILLLGGYGFIGTNILDFIDQNLIKFYNVILFDRFPKHKKGHTFKCIKRVYWGDFSDETNLISIFEENHIDYIFHFLSSTTPVTSNNALYDIDSNLIPTIKFLNVMQKYKVKDIVYLSSGGAIYGDYQNKIHCEEDAVYPKSSYGIVKLAIEKYLLSYAELYGFNTLILRLSNPYGKYHYNDKQGIVNIAIRKALNNEPLQIWGSGNGVKDYIFVDDVCNILFSLIENGIETEVYNLAAGSAHSVNEIATMIKLVIPNFSWNYSNAAILDIQSFELDITKLRNRLGGYRFTSFEEGIKKTIEWEKIIYDL